MSNSLALFPAPPKSNDIDLRKPQLSNPIRTKEDLKVLSQHLSSAQSAAQLTPEKTRKDAAAVGRGSIDIARASAIPPAFGSQDTTPSLSNIFPVRRSMDTQRDSRPQFHVCKRSSTSDLNTVTENAEQTFPPPHRQYTAPASQLSSGRHRTPMSTSSSIYSRRTSDSTSVSENIDTPATSRMASPLSVRKRSASKRSVILETPLTLRSSSSFGFVPEDDCSHKAISTPTRPAFTIAMTTNPAFPPRSHSLRTDTTIMGTQQTAKSVESQPLPQHTTSMFPTYDASKPLSQQSYFPLNVAIPDAPLMDNDSTDNSTAPMVNEKSSPPTKLTLRKDSGVSVAVEEDDGLSEIEFEDLNDLWTASTRLGACSGRKLRLRLRSDSPASRSYTVLAGENPLFSADMERPEAKDKSVVLSLHKINPVTGDAFLLSNVNIPPATLSTSSPQCSTSFFPQQAAIDALTAASNGPRAADIARSDRSVRHRAAEKLAKEAVAEARETYTSELVRVSRVRDSIGTISATYTLTHATAGDLSITVGRSVPLQRMYSIDTPQVKITIHRPSSLAAPDDKRNDTALLSLDFAHGECIVDLPGLLSLEAEYMLDTAIAALFATAAMEMDDDKSNSEAPMTFDAPPRVAVKLSRKQKKELRKNKPDKSTAKSSHSVLWLLRKPGVREIDDIEDEMPGPAKSALAIIELGINGAFWALEKGFKSIDERNAKRPHAKSANTW